MDDAAFSVAGIGMADRMALSTTGVGKSVEPSPEPSLLSMAAAGTTSSSESDMTIVSSDLWWNGGGSLVSAHRPLSPPRLRSRRRRLNSAARLVA